MKFDFSNAVFHHVVDGIAAAAAHADYFNLRSVLLNIVKS